MTRRKIKNLAELFQSAKRKPPIDKSLWVLEQTKGKSVLDLGCIGHTIARVDADGDSWLHKKIFETARETVGLDILREESLVLNQRGYNIISGDAQRFSLKRTFETIICGDLIEHVNNPGLMLECIRDHMTRDGVALISTPNPLAIRRVFNIISDGSTPVNTEHTCWFCPQTLFQLVERLNLTLLSIDWLNTAFPMYCQPTIKGRILNKLSTILIRRHPYLNNDFGFILGLPEEP